MQNLREWKKLIDQRFANNLALKAKISASATRGNEKSDRFIAGHLIDSNPETYWTTDDDSRACPVIAAVEVY